MVDCVTIGERIRAVRQMRDLEAKDVAAHLSMKTNTYLNYETGARAVKANVLYEICDILDVEPNYIFGVSDYPYSIRDRVSKEEELEAILRAKEVLEEAEKYLPGIMRAGKLVPRPNPPKK